MFAGCYKLEEVKIRKENETIPSEIFYDCFNLKKVEIEDGVTEIDMEAFENNYCLEKIFIPKTVTKISNYPFTGCENLTVYCEAEEKPEGFEPRWSYGVKNVVWGSSRSDVA